MATSSLRANPLMENLFPRRSRNARDAFSRRSVGRASAFSNACAGALSYANANAGACAFVFMVLAGCAAQEPATPVQAPPAAAAPAAREAPSPPVQQLTAAARTALQNAEQSVADARARQALWTSAVQALEQARVAAQRLDNEAVVRISAHVRELVQLGLKQRQSPPVKLFD